MKYKIAYDSTGFIYGMEDEGSNNYSNYEFILVDSPIPYADVRNFYVDNGTIIQKSERPSLHAAFDLNTKTWVDQRTPADFEAERVAGIVQQIAELEDQITPRRIREAILSGDHTFITSIESQIDVLRQSIIS